MDQQTLNKIQENIESEESSQDMRREPKKRKDSPKEFREDSRLFGEQQFAGDVAERGCSLNPRNP